MAENEQKSGGALSGLFKAIASSLVGLVSGAVIMYLSPLVNSAIKPPKPVPNFSHIAEGTLVTFTNRSTGGTQGWWDFGDGSELEPFSPSQASIAHKFPTAGKYTVKLSLHNLIGEETERTATIRIESQAAAPPVIEDLQAIPISPGRSKHSGGPTAPASFKFVARVKNADTAIWSIDDQPLEIVSAAAGQTVVETYATFTYYGPKKAKLVVVNGKNLIEKTVDLWIDVPDDEPQILIYQSYQMAQAETVPISVSFPPNHGGASYPFEITRAVRDGLIADAHMDRPNDTLIANPQLLVAGDKKSFIVRGELLRPRGVVSASPTSWFGKVELKVVGRATGAKRSEPVAALLQVPGRTLVNLPPVPAGAGATGTMNWEIRQGMNIVMKDTKAPATQVVRLRDQTYRVTIQQVGAQIQVDTAAMAHVPLVPASRPGMKK